MTYATVVPGQIRSARAFVNWTIQDLSASSEVSVRTIKYIESTEDFSGVRKTTLLKLIHALEQAGIEFIGTPDDGPGIRFRKSTAAATTQAPDKADRAKTPDRQE